MTFLIVAATALEIEPFVSWMNTNSPFRRNLNVDILVTGVGLTAATYALTRQVHLKRPDFIIQAGVAGSFEKGLKQGSVVIVKQDAIGDLGAMEKGQFSTIFDLRLAMPDQFPYSKGWLINKSPLLKQLKIPKVRGVTINEISTRPERITLYKRSLRPVVESMEGAALHYVCLMEHIPFIQLRSVSNYVGDRDKKNWKMNVAIHTLNRQLIKLLEWWSTKK